MSPTRPGQSPPRLHAGFPKIGGTLLGVGGYKDITPVMENLMENEMETGFIYGIL